MKTVIRILIPLLILGAGWLLKESLASRKEGPVYRKQDRKSPPTVTTTEIRRSNFQVIIRSHGVVRAHNSTSLTPRVSGRIMRIDERFEDGAFFKTDDILIELDPTDFNAAVAAAEARVARAEAVLAQEQALAAQALLDWKDLGYTEKPSDLVKRLPQLKEANANLAAAQAEMAAAKRTSDRAKIVAPYDGCVLQREAGLGQSVGPGSTLGKIFSTNFAEIRLPLKTSDLNFFDLPESKTNQKISARISDSLGNDPSKVWTGEVVRSEGALNTSSLELFVITRVEDPYGLKSGHQPLRIGQPVKAELDGRVLKDVIVLPRKGMRGPAEIVLVNPDDMTIQRVQVSPIWEDPDHVVVRDNLPEEWLLVTSQLPYAANGSVVKVLSEEEADPALNASQGTPSGGTAEGG